MIRAELRDIRVITDQLTKSQMRRERRGRDRGAGAAD